MSQLKDYLQESLPDMLQKAGIIATTDQISKLAEYVADGVSDFHNRNMIQRLEAEIKKLKGVLEKEKEKKACPVCNGKGMLHPFSGGVCETCNGEGKV